MLRLVWRGLASKGVLSIINSGQMNLKEQIKNDLKNSMKSGDNTVRGVLRMLFSDIKNVKDSKIILHQKAK